MSESRPVAYQPRCSEANDGVEIELGDMEISSTILFGLEPPSLCLYGVSLGTCLLIY